MKTVKVLMMAMGLCLMAACSGRYAGMPRAEVLGYQTYSTYGHLYDMAYAYAEAINAAVDADTLHPGMLADYGVALALMGHDGEACRMLNAEAQAFPQSRQMVYRIKQHMIPEMLDDTTVNGRCGADMTKLQGWAYDSIARLAQLTHVASVVDSTDSTRINSQTPQDSVQLPLRLTANQKRELLAEEQMRAERRRQYVADSIAAAKRAAIDARKQAQADREHQKKLKKKEAQLRQKELKEKARQRDKEKKQKAAEKQKQKKKKGGGK